jgi:hypothetical protein
MTDPSENMLRFFSYSHLPDLLQETSAPFFTLADDLVQALPPGPEKTMCIRKLLEAKDCAARAVLPDDIRAPHG